MPRYNALLLVQVINHINNINSVSNMADDRKMHLGLVWYTHITNNYCIATSTFYLLNVIKWVLYRHWNICNRLSISSVSLLMPRYLMICFIYTHRIIWIWTLFPSSRKNIMLDNNLSIILFSCYILPHGRPTVVWVSPSYTNLIST